MLKYIETIQRKFVEDYCFPQNEMGLPKEVPDGAYPMIIDDKLDLVVITGGIIWCCNFIGTPEGLSDFVAQSIKRRQS